MTDLSDTTKALIQSVNAKVVREQRRAEIAAAEEERRRQWESLCEHQWKNASVPTIKRGIQEFIGAMKAAGCALEIYDAGLYGDFIRMFITVGTDSYRNPHLDFWREGKSARASASACNLPNGKLDPVPDLFGPADVTSEWVIQVCERFFQIALRLPTVVPTGKAAMAVERPAPEMKITAAASFLEVLQLPAQDWQGDQPEVMQHARFAGHDLMAIADKAHAFDLRYLNFQTGGFPTMKAAKAAAPEFARKVLALMAAHIQG
jgi:hypothetical protein